MNQGGEELTSQGRNRSEGWQHAKLDGHFNEVQFAESLINNQEFVSSITTHLLKVFPKDSPEISVDGSKKVESIFGDNTTSKVDLVLNWNSGEQVNISLKKSESGQVWLISVPRFISAIEYYLNKKIELEVRIGLSLFIGGSNISNYESYFEKALNLDRKRIPNIAEQESHQSRLVAKSINTHFPSIWGSLLDFFKSNIGLITELSFAQGLAKSKKEQAHLIVYNKVVDGKSVFPISKIIKDAISLSKVIPIDAGPKNGGSTLLLPTGFLQMHHPQEDNLLQFHHQYKKISKL